MPRYYDYKNVPANEIPDDKKKELEKKQKQEEDEMHRRLKQKINQYNFVQDLFEQASQQRPQTIGQQPQRQIEFLNPYEGLI